MGQLILGIGAIHIYRSWASIQFLSMSVALQCHWPHWLVKSRLLSQTVVSPWLQYCGICLKSTSVVLHNDSKCLGTHSDFKNLSLVL